MPPSLVFLDLKILRPVPVLHTGPQQALTDIQSCGPVDSNLQHHPKIWWLKTRPSYYEDLVGQVNEKVMTLTNVHRIHVHSIDKAAFSSSLTFFILGRCWEHLETPHNRPWLMGLRCAEEPLGYTSRLGESRHQLQRTNLGTITLLLVLLKKIWFFGSLRFLFPLLGWK